MGDRYIIAVVCPDCGFLDDNVYFAPTCGFTTWDCPKCSKKVDLVELTGITPEEASNVKMIEDMIDFYKEKM